MFLMIGLTENFSNKKPPLEGRGGSFNRYSIGLKLYLASFNCIIAFFAVDWAILGGRKRYLSCYSTVGTYDLSHRPASLFSLLTAFPTTGWFIREPFFRIELLLTRGENKLRTALFTHQCFVLVH